MYRTIIGIDSYFGSNVYPGHYVKMAVIQDKKLLHTETLQFEDSLTFENALRQWEQKYDYALFVLEKCSSNVVWLEQLAALGFSFRPIRITKKIKEELLAAVHYALQMRELKVQCWISGGDHLAIALAWHISNSGAARIAWC